MKEIRPMKVTNNFYNYYFKSNITLKKKCLIFKSITP